MYKIKGKRKEKSIMSIMKRLGFLAAFLIPLTTWLDVMLLQNYWLTVAFVFILVPLLDELVGRDPENVSEAAVLRLSEERYFRHVLLTWTVFQFGFLSWAALHVAGRTNWEALDFIGFTLSVALSTGGVGITAAHELGHKRTRVEQWAAQGLLMTVGYMHFFIEHNLGHHVWVATPHDPATARHGQSVYSFWRQSVFGGWRSAWRLEKQRLQRSRKALWSLNNRMILYSILPLGFLTGLLGLTVLATGTFSMLVVVFWLGQAVLAFTLLEIVNYLEHYGIRRREIAPMRYERVNPKHSWNANHLVSNLLLFQLQRHSDHHAHSGRRYQVLRHMEESPQLPFGYPLMILIALVPSLWFGYMHPRLQAWKNSSIEKVA